MNALYALQACAVMALERVPADIRAAGGVARMVSSMTHRARRKSVDACVLITRQSDPSMIKEIVEAVTIPVMAKVRIGHFVEAQVGFARIFPCFGLLIWHAFADPPGVLPP